MPVQSANAANTATFQPPNHLPFSPLLSSPLHPLAHALQVPEVHVTARAFLPSTSLVTFELANGLSFTTFVSTCPVSGWCAAGADLACAWTKVLLGAAGPLAGSLRRCR